MQLLTVCDTSGRYSGHFRAVVFGFAIAGILAKFLVPLLCYEKNKWAEERLYRYDQWCNPVENSVEPPEGDQPGASGDDICSTTSDDTEKNRPDQHLTKRRKVLSKASNGSEYQSCGSDVVSVGGDLPY